MDLLKLYHYFNTEIADPKTKDWALIASPVPIVLMSIAYLYFVLKYGPRYMKDKPAYSFNTFIRIYNIFQIVANAWIVYSILEAGWFRDYFIYCKKVDYSPSVQNMKFATTMWYTYCLKIFDFIETILFVLRKKQRQISFLHVYHHVSTALIAWQCVKYFANGMILIVLVINCSIHVVMYTYYLLSSFGPSMQKLLNPIKPMITSMQIMQFWIIILHGLQSFIPGCPGTEPQAVVTVTNTIINLVLFTNFYKQNYTKKKKQE